MREQKARTILGLGTDASAEEARAAYRRLAMKHHPDRNIGDASAEEKFKEVKQAYESLSRGRAEEDLISFSFDFDRAGDPLADLFGAIFGNMRRPSLLAEVSLESAIRGGPLELDGAAFGASEVVAFELPAGTVDGAILDVRCSGKSYVVKIRVLAPEGWSVDGGVLRRTVELNLLDQLIGGTLRVEVPLLGSVEVVIPRSLSNGATFNIEHKSLKGYRAVLVLDFSKEISLNDTEIDLIKSAKTSYERRKT